MSFKTIEQRTPNFWPRVGPVTEIVIHHWGVQGQNIRNVVGWLCNPSSKVSANYVVQEGLVYHLSDAATWHAGNRSHNLKSIGIECRPEATDGDYQTVGELVAYIWKRYGKIPLIRHKDIVSTACPGVWDIGRIKSIAEAIYSGGDSIPTTSTSTVSELVRAGQAWSNKILGTSIAEDGEKGPETTTNKAKILQWAMNRDYRAGLVIDGLFKTASQKALGTHTVRQGETQYVVTALEILLLLNGYDPNGVEVPGVFGSGCARATGQFQSATGLVEDRIAGRNTFLRLIK